jgi:hypothetical protein
MRSIRELLLSPPTLAGIEAALTRRAGAPRGWIAVDGRIRGLPAVEVHARPWLQDADREPGFRLADEPVAFSVSAVHPGQAVVFLAGPAGQMDAEGNAALVEVLGHDLACLVMQVHEDRLLYRDPSDRWAPLPVAQPTVANPLDFELHGSRIAKREATLPFAVAAESALSRDFFRLRLLDGDGFQDPDLRFEIRTADASPLGRGKLGIDFAPDGAADRLVVTPEGFAGEVQVYARAAGNPWKRRFAPATPVRLHVLLDRTTLDLESWRRALEALMSIRPLAADEDSPTWNLVLREALALALKQRLPELHEPSRLELWWFADVALEGVAEPEGLPKSGITWGTAGECALDRLGSALAGAVFGYATGFDLVDAVDDGLEQVAASCLRLRDEQPAVLVVGDSPPPPRDEQDPIWQELIDHPLHTNTRRSPKFRAQLDALASRRVPVGWLFLRSSVPPELKDERLLKTYAHYQTLRERTLAALRATPHLWVESCDGPPDLDRALAAIFHWMKLQPEAPSRLHLGDWS